MLSARSRLLGFVVVIALAFGTTAALPKDSVPRFGHVFLIIGENTSYGQVTPKHAPFLTRSLKSSSAWLTDYHSFTASSSLGQYIALVSGQYTHCEANNDLPAHCHQNVSNLMSQLAASGRSWRDWQESMPAPCYPRDSGRPSLHNEYGAHHNPALYFTNLTASCHADNIAMGNTAAIATTAFDKALAQGDVGDFNIVVPNDCENGHDPCGGDGVRHFDAFLAREIPRIEGSPAFGKDGLIVVTWDEGGDPPQQPGHVLTVLTGPLVRHRVADRQRLDHFGLERTLALGLAVPPLAHAETAPAITGIWR